LSAAALDRLTAHGWPGNVRALRHAVERAVILSEETMLEPGDFSLSAAGQSALGQSAADAVPAALGVETSTLDAVEKEAILRALEAHGRNISRAAEALGLTRPSLYRRMQKYGL
jgi:DNA-binding NtrC family response regulator